MGTDFSIHPRALSCHFSVFLPLPAASFCILLPPFPSQARGECSAGLKQQGIHYARRSLSQQPLRGAAQIFHLAPLTSVGVYLRHVILHSFQNFLVGLNSLPTVLTSLIHILDPLLSLPWPLALLLCRFLLHFLNKLLYLNLASEFIFLQESELR